MLYMIVERFRNGDPKPIYKRFADRGRMAPDRLRYVSSWVDSSLTLCFQLMETDDRGALDEWMSHWNDLTDFDVWPVISSAEAAARVLSAE